MKDKEFNELLQKIEDGSFISDTLKISIDPFNNERDEERLNDKQAILLAKALKKNPNIKKLDLSCNNIGDEGAIALADVKSLEELNLYGNIMGLRGPTGLAKSNFKKLVLGMLSDIKEENQESLFSQMVNAFIANNTIMDLDISYYYLPDKMVAQLIGHNTTIKTLTLARYLTDEALELIGSNKTLVQLEFLENEITDKSIKYIAKNNNLKELSIGQSNITDVGAKILSMHPTLKKLSITDSNITFEGAKIFIGSNLDQLFISTNLKQHIMSREEYEDISDAFYCTPQFKPLPLITKPQDKFEEVLKDSQENFVGNKKIKLEDTRLDNTIKEVITTTIEDISAQADLIGDLPKPEENT